MGGTGVSPVRGISLVSTHRRDACATSDLRVTNPASNEPLLDALAREFLDSGFDMQHIVALRAVHLLRRILPHADGSQPGQSDKTPGRDHWASAMSVFLSGGGLKMGQAIGATNAKGEHPVDRIMNSNCLLATLYKKFGIDYHKPYYDNSGRPVPILTDGEPIAELL